MFTLIHSERVSCATCCPFVCYLDAFVYLVFPNSIVSVLTEGSLKPGVEFTEQGIITSVTHGAMAVDDYFSCLGLGRAAAAELSDFLRNCLKLKAGNDRSKAG